MRVVGKVGTLEMVIEQERFFFFKGLLKLGPKNKWSDFQSEEYITPADFKGVTLWQAFPGIIFSSTANSASGIPTVAQR